jgi:uncharacterized protein
MKYFLLTCFILTVSLTLSAQRTSIFPAPLGFINDYEGDFTPDEVKQLDYAVKELLAKTMEVDSLNGIEIAIVTVTENMFGDEKEMSGYVTRLGDKWGVAGKGENKAIIIAYGKKIRKVTIIAGAGLDRILPAAECHKIVDEKMAPEFRTGSYFGAILGAVNSIKEYIGLR